MNAIMTVFHGEIGPAQSENVKRLMQGGLYCKGYNPGAFDGWWGIDMGAACTRLMTAMGLGDDANGGLPAKVVKSLLTMDAYVVLGGGTQGVRQVQQWLNATYWERSSFDVIPCDGIFSRQVQKALLFAIQYEIGLTDSEATGTFGPTTQSRLRAMGQVGPGSVDGAKSFVRLFVAALLFNRRAVPFGGEFTAGVEAEVRAFQEFSALPVNGLGDFATWAQLLVSTGDPERPATGADCASEVTAARAAALRSAGYTTVGRYLTNVVGGTLDKKIKPGELATMFAAGLSVFPIFQENGRVLSDFSYSSGYTHGGAAHTAAAGWGFPPGATVYFAVDYDAQQTEIDGAIVPYFQGVSAALRDNGRRYAFGVYGSRNVCRTVTGATQARHSFVSGMSTGFSGNMGFPLPENWAFNQIKTLQVGSGQGAITIDKDVVSGRDPGTSRLDGGSVTAPLLAYVDALFDEALAYASEQGRGADHASVLVLRYLRLLEYNSAFWRTYLADAASDFTARADAARERAGFSARLEHAADPVTFDQIKISHLAATCEAVLTWPDVTRKWEANVGDLGGWAGDIITLLSEWWAVEPQNENAYQWVVDNFGRVDVSTTFDNRNLLDDVDGYNLAKRLFAGEDLRQAVRAYFGDGSGEPAAGRRFRSFLDGRFEGKQTAVAAAAQYVFTAPEFAAARVALGTGVDDVVASTLHRGQIEDFCQAFADQLLVRTGSEPAA